MPISMGQAIREFVALNQSLAAGALTPDRRRRWRALGNIVNLELARFEAREMHLARRRQATRALVRYPVQFLSAAVVGAGETVDLSFGGCALNADDQLRVGDEIELTVKLPGALGELHPTGRVRWTSPGDGARPCQAGVAFAAVDAQEHETLIACVLGTVAPFFVAEA